MLNFERKKRPIDEVKTAFQHGKMSEHKKSEGTAPAGKREYRETFLLFIKMLVTIFLCEAAIMVLLHIVPLTSGWAVIADPVLLTLLSTPILYWLLVRPVWRSLEQRNIALAALRKEKDKAQKYLDIAGVILVVLDREGRTTLINKKGSEVLGRNESEILGRNWFANFVPDAERKRTKACFEELMVGDTGALEYFENPVLTKDREERIIAWHNTVLRDEDGSAAGTLSSGEDITERKRIEEDLRKHREHLEELIQETVIEHRRARTATNRTGIARQHRPATCGDFVYDRGAWRKVGQ
jgi:PAS domain S-box-containing protein